MAPSPSPVTLPTGEFAVSGPALFYASTQENDGDGGQTIRRVDLSAPEGPRERAVCRALLQHALALMDASEPVRRGGIGVEGRRG
ncbi:hypothetical protein [Streptomyces sp. NPDC007074]|uniref:hypothetical protein n=1 Tax=Streptomyces sp. NPDC007074 TaxID=3156764 RepID=UPI0033E2AB07